MFRSALALALLTYNFASHIIYNSQTVILVIMYPVQLVYHNERREKLLILMNEKAQRKVVIYSTNPATNPTTARMLAALPLIRRAPLDGVVVCVETVVEPVEVVPVLG